MVDVPVLLVYSMCYSCVWLIVHLLLAVCGVTAREIFQCWEKGGCRCFTSSALKYFLLEILTKDSFYNELITACCSFFLISCLYLHLVYHDLGEICLSSKQNIQIVAMQRNKQLITRFLFIVNTVKHQNVEHVR